MPNVFLYLLVWMNSNDNEAATSCPKAMAVLTFPVSVIHQPVLIQTLDIATRSHPNFIRRAWNARLRCQPITTWSPKSVFVLSYGLFLSGRTIRESPLSQLASRMDDRNAYLLRIKNAAVYRYTFESPFPVSCRWILHAAFEHVQ